MESNTDPFGLENDPKKIFASCKNSSSLNHSNITTLCWEERITWSTTEAIQYGLESEAKAVAL